MQREDIDMMLEQQKQAAARMPPLWPHTSCNKKQEHHGRGEGGLGELFDGEQGLRQQEAQRSRSAPPASRRHSRTREATESIEYWDYLQVFQTRNPKSQTRSSKSETRNLKPETRSPKVSRDLLTPVYTHGCEALTLNPKP